MADKVASWLPSSSGPPRTTPRTTFTRRMTDEPQGAGVRHGLVGMVQNAFFKFDNDGVPVWDLKGKDLIQGETDGTSYPSGHRFEFRAARRTAPAAHVQVDSSSPIYLRGDTIFIPSCPRSSTFCSTTLLGREDGHGRSLRSVDALNREGVRLLKLLGYEATGLQSNIGLEQEIFLIPRDKYTERQAMGVLKPDHRVSASCQVLRRRRRTRRRGPWRAWVPGHTVPFACRQGLHADILLDHYVISRR